MNRIKNNLSVYWSVHRTVSLYVSVYEATGRTVDDAVNRAVEDVVSRAYQAVHFAVVVHT